MTDTETKFLLYKTDNSNISIDVIISNETLWTTQKAMAELFGVGVPAINKHLKNIYESGELAESATISKMETVQNEGARSVTRELTIYTSMPSFQLVTVSTPFRRHTSASGLLKRLRLCFND